MAPGNIQHVLSLLGAHEDRNLHCFHFTPPENSMSPLARLPFVLDGYGRYHFAGKYNFHGARELGAIEQQILIPLLRKQARARHVSVRPLSGLNCMTAAVAGLCPPGGTVLSVPADAGGHMSTPAVVERLGARVIDLPMRDPHEVDLVALEALLHGHQPALVYLDQSSQLFPIDPRPIRDLLDRWSPATLIHYDSSHTNGLILAGALPNPLERGADCFGGSTHKTLPGPHKAFLATNSADVAARLHPHLENLISQHQMAGVASLAITLIELEECGGADYAAAVLANARALARALDRRGLDVVARDRGYTGCHQVWLALPDGADVETCVEGLYRCGLVVNSFDGLPGVPRPALRLSVSEVTRLGAAEEDMDRFGAILASSIRRTEDEVVLRSQVRRLRSQLSAPRYCFDVTGEARQGLSPRLEIFAERLQELLTAPATTDGDAPPIHPLAESRASNGSPPRPHR